MSKAKPRYYKANAARQTMRERGRCLPERKAEERIIRRNREAMGDVFTLCITFAINQTYGIGAERLERVTDAASREAVAYTEDKDKRGSVRALERLRAKAADVLPAGYLLPAYSAPKNQAELLILQERREVAQTAAYLYALGMREALGFGARRVARVMESASQHYRDFRDLAEQGEWYAYNALAKRMERLIHEPVIVGEDNARPVFGKTLD